MSYGIVWSCYNLAPKKTSEESTPRDYSDQKVAEGRWHFKTGCQLADIDGYLTSKILDWGSLP